MTLARPFRSIAIALVALCALAVVPAHVLAEATLKSGAIAPDIKVAKWVKGTPVEKFEPGKVYLVYFWATWCKPCAKSIPRMSELAAKYPDLTVVGVSVWERDDAKVQPFVDEMGDKMKFSIALDDKGLIEGGEMAKTWMEAADQAAVPAAFVVDKQGKLAWVGDPLEAGPVVDSVMTGKFDPDVEAKRAAQAAVDAEKLTRLKGELEIAAMQQKWDEVIRIFSEIEPLDHANGPMVPVMQFRVYAQAKKDMAAANAFARTYAEQNPTKGEAINGLAFEIVSNSEYKTRDLELAEKLALQANTILKGENPQVLDTVAAVYAVRGDLDKAIAWQTKAVEKSDAASKPGLQKTLDGYKARVAKP
ncbi:MAG: redoxin domain-containing protein [Tepidisphaeraceae bacterium]